VGGHSRISSPLQHQTQEEVVSKHPAADNRANERKSRCFCEKMCESFESKQRIQESEENHFLSNGSELPEDHHLGPNRSQIESQTTFDQKERRRPVGLCIDRPNGRVL